MRCFEFFLKTRLSSSNNNNNNMVIMSVWRNESERLDELIYYVTRTHIQHANASASEYVL